MSTVGEIRITYELQTLRAGLWYRVNAWDDKAEAVEAAVQVMENKTVPGARVCRLVRYTAHDFTESVIIFKLLESGISESDPLLPPVEPEEEVSWTDPADVYRESGRAELRTHLAKYLEEEKITSLELLHSDHHMTILDGAGTHLQGLLQKMAVAMVRNSKRSSAELFKALLALSGTILQQVRADAEKLPVPPLEPGRFGLLCKAFEAHFEGQQGIYHIYRTIAAYLLRAENWLEKINRIGLLLGEATLDVRYIRLLDILLAEILGFSGPYRELYPEDADRVQAIRSTTDFYAGRYVVPTGTNPPGFDIINRRLVEGALPRSRATLRQRMLREVHFRQPLLPGSEIMPELEITASVHRYVAEATAELAQDEEFAQAFDMRVGRAITPETMAKLLAGQAKIADKVRLVARVLGMTPGEGNRAIIGKYFRALVSPEDVVRQAVRDGGSRLAAVGPLVELWSVLAASPVDDVTRAEVLHTVDNALLDIFRTDILNAPNRTYLDRILILAQTATAMPLPDGKAKLFAAQTIGKELKNPRFLPAYIAKCRNEAEKADHMNRLRHLMVSSGVGVR